MSFSSLVQDIQVYLVIHFLPTSSLLSLSRVSRHCNALVRPVLYTSVSFRLDVTSAPVPYTKQGAKTMEFRARQSQFWNTLLARKDDGLPMLVKTLEWDVRLFPRIHWTVTDRDEFELLELFTIFLPLLLNVRSLVLRFPDHGDLPEPLRVLPSLTHVTLSGCVSPFIASSILHTPSQITNLSLQAIWPPDAHISLLAQLRDIYDPFCNLRSLSLHYGTMGRAAFNPDPEPGEVFDAWRDTLYACRSSLKSVHIGWKFLRGYVFPEPEVQLAERIVPLFVDHAWPVLEVLVIEGTGNFEGVWAPLNAKGFRFDYCEHTGISLECLR